MKILMPVDGSSRDGIARTYCVRLAGSLGAALVVVRAVSWRRALLRRNMDREAAHVAEVESDLRAEGLEVQGIVCQGDPAKVISAVAEAQSVDMIVMVTRGRGTVGKLVLGSVGDGVLASSSKPVVLLSEAGSDAMVDEKTRLQSMYLALVVWQRQRTGVYTSAQAEAHLTRLAEMGLDRSTLASTYKEQKDHGASLGWLDIGLQVKALSAYLPEEPAAGAPEALPEMPEVEQRAA